MNDEPQNIWQFLLICFGWISDKSGRLINTVIGVASILGVSNQISALLAAKISLGGAILGYARSQWTANTVNTAQAIVAKAKAPEVPLAQTITQTIKDTAK